MEEALKQILLELKELKQGQGLLVEMNARLKKVEGNVAHLEGSLNRVKDKVESVDGTVRKIESTVNRIEVSQTEDVVGMLKISKKNTELETDYINSRLTQMDKRIFQLEKRVEN